jgi:phosphonoacetaldehyde hydrolase
MERLMPLAAAQGFVPEVTICAGDLAAGRPAPLQIWSALAQMGIWPASSVIKLDDTAPGIGEGRAAGCWAVGAALTGNNPGLTAEELMKLPADQRAEFRHSASERLLRAGAHLVIDSIAELPWLVGHIEARLASDERPGVFEAN